MQSIKLDKPIESVKIIESQEQYLEREFPLSGKEYQVDFKRVGEYNFRINFWSYVKRDSSLSQFKSSQITRSCFVSLKRTKTGWIHTIG